MNKPILVDGTGRNAGPAQRSSRSVPRGAGQALRLGRVGQKLSPKARSRSTGHGPVRVSEGCVLGSRCEVTSRDEGQRR